MNQTIVFIHGAWMTPKCWEPFVSFFTARGYTCQAPAWPYHDRPVAELRASPDPGLKQLGLGEIIDHYVQIIKQLPEPPVLIGHSFGGLVTQVLLDRGLGAAGVALDPAPPRGILAAAYPTTTRALLRIIATPGGWHKVFHWSLGEFAYAFVNTLPPEEQKRAYDEFVVPESGRLFFENAFSLLNARTPGQVNFKNGRRAPLLITAGTKDHIVPAAMVRANFLRYSQQPGTITEYQEFPGGTHWLIAQSGWEMVAGSVEFWLRKHVSHARASRRG
ncbi:MAG TPA: alpha/beta hydrolase [Ktedonobacterales bacterium]|nr:alpha/beta hydrolase [Ktedonobacterales bacterium]